MPATLSDGLQMSTVISLFSVVWALNHYFLSFGALSIVGALIGPGHTLSIFVAALAGLVCAALWAQIIEGSASSELYALLKRQDEKTVTERAYENPVFVEDLVRNVALRLNAHPDVRSYKVEAENFESIHNHNAYACIEKP